MELMSKAEKIIIRRCMIVCWLALISYMYFNSMAIVKNQEQQIKTLEIVQTKQEEIITNVQVLGDKIDDIDKDVENLDIVFEEIDGIKETTYDIKIMEFQAEMSALDLITDKEKWFLEYKDLCERYEEYIGVPVSIYDVYTEEEIIRIERMVETEVGSGDFMSKVHVADVVWNRMENEKWPNTIDQIIVLGQFAYGKTTISESTRLAVEYSFMFPDETNGALAFHSMKQTERFGNYYYIFTDSAKHHFYGEKQND